MPGLFDRAWHGFLNMAKKCKEDIFVETTNLLSDLYDFQWEMPKRDRIVLGNSIYQHTERVLGCFMLSYKLDNSEIDDKIRAINEMITEFSVVVVDIRRLVAAISPNWWKYVDMDWNRLCIVAKEGYKHKDIVKLKYNKVWNRLNNRLTNRKPL